MNINKNIENKKKELIDFFENHNIPYKKYFNNQNEDCITFIKLDNNIKFNNKISDEMNYAICTLFQKNINKKSKTILFYFCGYDDCFYHPHMFNSKHDFDIMVIDIPGFGFNKKYTDNYDDGKFFNYYDNINNLNKSLDIVFNNIHKYVEQYDTKILYGHSTGGNILINYVYYLEKNKIDTYNNIKFDKLLLNSPLTKLAHQNYILEVLLKIIVNIVTIFTYYIDINAIVFGTNKKNNFKIYNKILNNVNNTNSNIDYDYIYPYKSKIIQAKLAGWIATAENSIKQIINNLNDKRLNLPCKCICSTQFSKSIYALGDDCLNPKYIQEDINNIFENINIEAYQCIHDCLLEPGDDNDNENDNITYIDILNYLFE